MHFYTNEDVKKAVTLGKLKIMKHPSVPCMPILIQGVSATPWATVEVLRKCFLGARGHLLAYIAGVPGFFVTSSPPHVCRPSLNIWSVWRPSPTKSTRERKPFSTWTEVVRSGHILGPPSRLTSLSLSTIHICLASSSLSTWLVSLSLSFSSLALGWRSSFHRTHRLSDLTQGRHLK